MSQRHAGERGVLDEAALLRLSTDYAHLALCRDLRDPTIHDAHTRAAVRVQAFQRGYRGEPQAWPPSGAIGALLAEPVEAEQPAPLSAEGVAADAAGNGENSVYVIITLLGEVAVTVVNPATGQRARVDMQSSPKRRELLAYFAWQRKKTIPRTAILHDVFKRHLQSRPAEDEAEDEARRAKSNFATQVKLLRNDINAVAQTIGLPRLRVVEHAKEWWLAPYCRVSDLDTIEQHYRRLEQVVREQTLVTPEVAQACDHLISAYQGDFLEKHVRNHEFDPWSQCWVRVPFTTYRDIYLTALWTRAEYEVFVGETIMGESEQDRLYKQCACFERAARLYEEYALYAPNTRFDTKVYGREPGERIRLGERALQRAMAMYSRSQNTQAADAAFEGYKRVMRSIFPPGVGWEPSVETREVLAEARAHTR